MKIIAIVTSLLAIALLWLMHESRAQFSTSPTAVSAAPARVVVTPHPMTSPSSSVPAPAIVTPVVAPQPADDDLSPIAQSHRMQDRFIAERTDATWARTAQLELHDDLGRFAGQDIQIQEVECRSTLCRVELAFARPDLGMTFMQKWLAARTWTGPGVAENQPAPPDGPQRMVVFLGKPGTEL